MPLRSITREQRWFLPPSMDELVGADHPARFVAAFVEALDGVVLREMGVAVAGAPTGAPSYPPRLLLSVWLYGFLRGVRLSRKLEVACQEQLPFLWLSGGSHPDHNTLWRFYQAHRQQMRLLLKRSARTAVTRQNTAPARRRPQPVAPPAEPVPFAGRIDFPIAYSGFIQADIGLVPYSFSSHPSA